jgi:hypothetical protein
MPEGQSKETLGVPVGSEETLILERFYDPAISDPLTEVTRAERKALLVASLVAAAVAQGGLIPKKVEALGIELTSAQVTTLLYIIAIVLAYLLIGFAIYAFTDTRHRGLKIAAAMARTRPVAERARKEYEMAQAAVGVPTAPGDLSALAPLMAIADQTTRTTALLRAAGIRLVFEVHLPLFLGLVALGLTMWRTGGFPGWRIVGAVGGAAMGLAIGWLLWRNRAKIKHWRGVKLNHYYMRRTKRLTEQLKAAKPGSSEHLKLQAKARAAVQKAIKQPWV